MSKKRSPKSSEEAIVNEILDECLATLFPYQREWVLDRSRFKICNKARQIGISTCLGLEGVLDVLEGQSVFFVSRTERQSIYLLDKFYTWMDIFASGDVPVSYESRSRTECRINGCDIKSLTSEAVAGEGFSGNVYLDEFALHDNDVQIYRSLFPVITWGFKIRLVSRPFGQNNKFYEIWSDTDKYKDYKRYEFDVNRAVGDGLPIDIQELRNNFDEQGFAENYLCQFLDESTSFFSYDLLRRNIGEEYSGTDGDNYLGVDVARKHDKTILYIGSKLGDKIKTREIIERRGVSYNEQKVLIADTIKRYNVKGGAVDGSGLGSQLAEDINNEFPFMENHWFSNQSKEGMATKVKMLFESNRLTIPDRQELLADIHGIRRMSSRNNNAIFDAAKTSEGHSDRFWAMALMVRSAFDYQKPLVVFY